MRGLDGVRAKIERAEQHARDLEREVPGVLRGNPPGNGLVAGSDPRAGSVAHRVRFRRPTPPAVSLIAGDIARDPRSALDHLTWQSADVNGGEPREAR